MYNNNWLKNMSNITYNLNNKQLHHSQPLAEENPWREGQYIPQDLSNKNISIIMEDDYEILHEKKITKIYGNCIIFAAHNTIDKIYNTIINN